MNMSYYRNRPPHLLRAGILFCAALPLLAADADLILKNGRIWTGDSDNPWAEAIAIRGARIIAVGNNQPVAEYASPGARVIDLRGRLAIPGFNDAHTHFLGGSLTLSEVDLNGACTVPEMQKKLRDYAAAHPKDVWITGGGWQYECFPDHRLPTRFDIDAVVKDRPVFLSAYDGHTAWVNSRALQIANVGLHTHFTGFGQLVADAKTGEPTGCLKETAQSLVSKFIPEPSREKKLAALEQGLKLATSLGITSIQNASGDAELLSLFDELERQHKLILRVNVALSVPPSMQDDAIDHLLELKQNYHGPRLHAGAVKFVLDGVIESHTAAMLAPYSDGSNTSGKPAWAQDAYNHMVVLCDSGGFQILTHAIGDRSVRMALDAYEEARKMNGPHGARFRIEHIETISPVDIPRFAKLGVIASMQPIHADPGTVDVWSKAVGPERLKLAFPWRSLEEAGARLVFSSDWPATISCDPIRGLHNAVNRQTIDGKPPGGWIPAQRVSIESAVRAYTVTGAYASLEEKIKGKLKPGMLADIAVLSQDLFSIPPADIYKTKVELTIFDGQVVFTRQ
jgi:predicted amidohydrolase YtcJ